MTVETPSPEPRRSIVAEYDLPYPPEKVWRALTEPELLAAWLMPNDIQMDAPPTAAGGTHLRLDHEGFTPGFLRVRDDG